MWIGRWLDCHLGTNIIEITLSPQSDRTAARSPKQQEILPDANGTIFPKSLNSW
jgi:hypothetical protein